MKEVKIYLESAILDKTEVFTKIKGLFEYTRDTDKLYYKHTSKDTFRFSTVNDYAIVKEHYENECTEITVFVEYTCAGEIVEYWTGFFTMFESVENRDKCYIDVKVKPLDAYKCFEAALKLTANLFAGTAVTTQAIGGEVEEQLCTAETLDGDCADYYAAYYDNLDTCLAEPTNWCKKSNKVFVNNIEQEPECYLNPTGLTIRQETTWHRETFTNACEIGEPVEPTFAGGWSLLLNSCAGDGTAEWWRCPSGNSGMVLGAYTRGRMFNGVIENLVSGMGCGLTVKSEFFGINAIDDAPNNIAYAFAELNCKNITIHQKSDIKYKSVVTPSTAPAWNVSLKSFFEDLDFMFNVKVVIINGVLILEHYSYFSANSGIDLTGKTKNKTLNYGSVDNVKTELFYWPEDVSFAFLANPIVYDCGEEVKEKRCTVLHTDLDFIENTANAERVGNSGFVLVCNELNGTDLIIKDSNLPFNWVSLQENLHKHGRLFKSGTLNGDAQTFLSWLPYIKQDKFKFTRCCGDTFNPGDSVTTDLGVGYVASAEENIFTESVEIEIAY